jgi:LacI family transcriptional regulator
MPVTIKDVAKRLNLSITTVSRALDGYADVAEETRRRVEQTAREMGYSPNPVARQLRRQRSETIGYILPAYSPRFGDPYFSEFTAGLGDEAASRNYNLLISTAPPGEESERMLYHNWVQGRRVEGFVLNRLHLQDWRVQYLAENEIPFVTSERTLDQVEYGYIEVDGRTGMIALMAHLIEMGHSRIGYIGGPSYLSLQANRFSGYREGLLAAGLRYDPELVLESDLTRAGGYQNGLRLLNLPQPPTAIACVNDLTAIGLMRAARECGLEAGRDLAVAGFDGIEESEHTSPPLTTLVQPVYEIARRLLAMLFQILHGEPVSEPRQNIQAELVIRKSTRP